MSAIINHNNDKSTLQSEAFMTEVRDGYSKVANSASAQFEEVGRLKAEVMQKLHFISDRLEAVPGMAREQLLTLQSLVEIMSHLQLERRAEHEGSLERERSETYHTENDASDGSQMFCDPEVEKTMAKTCNFAGGIKTHRISKYAQSVIEDIGRLLGLMMQQMSVTNPSRDEMPRKRKVLCDHHYSELETEVQTIENLAKTKRVLTAFQRVQMAKQGRYRY